MVDIARPVLEGTIAVGEDRRLGFAEFGQPNGRAMIWLHGTPGARRQIPLEARAFADHANVRLIGIDRPGIGSSTPYVYESVLGFAEDLRTLVDCLGVEKFAVIGLSGGGPYALAAASAMPDRVVAVGVLGGVAPASGPDAISGGLMDLGVRLAPFVRVGRVPLGIATTAAIRLVKPLASPILDLYSRFSPPGDRRLLGRPEFKAMFLDDLLNGSRKQVSAPFADVMLFARDWGFRLSSVKVPVLWWHGDADHIVPYSHGEHVVSLLPDAELHPLSGESHLAGLGVAEDILAALLKVWDSSE